MPPSSSQSGNRSLERQAMWLSALQANRLPAFVTQRLNDARDGKTPWISVMTAAELLIVRKYGIRPVAMVSATCALHYGYSWTRGHAEGWRTAIARLKQEAIAAGANAVVDVKFQASPLGVFKSIDYMLSGTAVQIAGLPASPDPIIATVPALGFVRLLEAGIVPVGIAIGAAYDWLTVFSSSNAYSNTPSYIFPISGEYRSEEWKDNADGLAFTTRPLNQLRDFWESIRQRAITDVTERTKKLGNGLLAHTHFSELIKLHHSSEDGRKPAYLGRHIILGTVVDMDRTVTLPFPIKLVIDMRDSQSPLSKVESGLESRLFTDMDRDDGVYLKARQAFGAEVLSGMGTSTMNDLLPETQLDKNG